MTRTPPVDQSALWNGPGGQVWVAQQAILDGLFQPMADLLVAELPETVTQLLDVGCGTGASLLASAAARPATHSTGLDISAPMLALARQRAEAAGLDADFIVADAQRHPLPSAHFDWIQSRLGVMFFEDSQAAFANLHRAATPGAGLRFIAWRSADENHATYALWVLHRIQRSRSNSPRMTEQCQLREAEVFANCFQIFDVALRRQRRGIAYQCGATDAALVIHEQ